MDGRFSPVGSYSHLRLSPHLIRWNKSLHLQSSWHKLHFLDFCKSWSIISIHSSGAVSFWRRKNVFPCLFWVFHFMSFQKPPSISIFLWQLASSRVSLHLINLSINLVKPYQSRSKCCPLRGGAAAVQRQTSPGQSSCPQGSSILSRGEADT